MIDIEDLAWRMTFEHGTTTVNVRLDGDADIDEVLEAVDYALRGCGYNEALVRDAFARRGQ